MRRSGTSTSHQLLMKKFLSLMVLLTAWLYWANVPRVANWIFGRRRIGEAEATRGGAPIPCSTTTVHARGAAAVNNAVVVTNGAGAPSESITLPNGIVATTQTAGDNSTKVATTAFVTTAVGPPATTALTTTTPTATWVNKGSYDETLTGNTTITFAGTVDNYGVVVTLHQTTGNSYTATFVAQSGFTLEWPNGVTPVMTVGAKTDTYFFHCDGTIVYGSTVQNYSP